MSIRSFVLKGRWVAIFWYLKDLALVLKMAITKIKFQTHFSTCVEKYLIFCLLSDIWNSYY